MKIAQIKERLEQFPFELEEKIQNLGKEELLDKFSEVLDLEEELKKELANIAALKGELTKEVVAAFTEAKIKGIRWKKYVLEAVRHVNPPRYTELVQKIKDTLDEAAKKEVEAILEADWVYRNEVAEKYVIKKTLVLSPKGSKGIIKEANVFEKLIQKIKGIGEIFERSLKDLQLVVKPIPIPVEEKEDENERG